MDEVIGLLVEAIAKRTRSSATAAQPIRVMLPKAPSGTSAPVPRVADAPPPIPDPGPAPGAFAFGSVPVPAAVLQAEAPREPLLSAFASRDAFLAAFVLSEALALPVSLREPRSA